MVNLSASLAQRGRCSQIERARNVGGDRLERPADLAGGVGLHVPHVDVAGAAFQEEEDAAPAPWPAIAVAAWACNCNSRGRLRPAEQARAADPQERRREMPARKEDVASLVPEGDRPAMATSDCIDPAPSERTEAC